ncbi:Cytochrome c-type biogenesis protein CcmE [Salmonella enterica subsp. enterica serovar Typhimurium]|uniref:Cytochrome c-type biogenesis protein CcmE n=1 Tax=Salmonella typhimurium TaxID=90371 RepID=A0A7G2DIA2_SALTM|nr:Cytochrome c-type biogenesis protein CcmE [Salmonella enterica subsp. enterica serovar Typhimurium]
MNLRRKNRLWVVCAVLAGLGLTTATVLYALRANIDLFYTPPAKSSTASARRSSCRRRASACASAGW